MSIKAILVPVQGIEHDIHVLRGAIRLAQAHDAHVTALFAQPTRGGPCVHLGGLRNGGASRQPAGGNGPGNETAGADGWHAAGAGGARSRNAHRACGTGTGASVFVSLRIERGMLRTAAATLAAFHDLVVYSHDPMGVDVHPVDESLLEATLLDARRPAFLAPKLARDHLPFADRDRLERQHRGGAGGHIIVAVPVLGRQRSRRPSGRKRLSGGA